MAGGFLYFSSVFYSDCSLCFPSPSTFDCWIVHFSVMVSFTFYTVAMLGTVFGFLINGWSFFYICLYLFTLCRRKKNVRWGLLLIFVQSFKSCFFPLHLLKKVEMGCFVFVILFFNKNIKVSLENVVEKDIFRYYSGVFSFLILWFISFTLYTFIDIL